MDEKRPTLTRSCAAVLVVAAALSLSTAGAAGSPSRDAANERGGARAVAVSREADLAHEIAAEINAVRRARGLSSLRSSPLLGRAGSAHATWLATAGSFTHDWPAGRPFSRWILGFYPATGYGQWTAGENLLWRSPAITSEEALALWLASPPHRRNLLSRAWHELGVAVVRADGASGIYAPNDPVFVVAAEFGARSR